MKIIGNIFFALAVCSLLSCSRESVEPTGLSPEVRGEMEIQVTARDADTAEEDIMETIRFIVFKNAATMPTLELNELFDIPAAKPGEEEVSKFNIVLDVSRKVNGSNHKLVVAIVNEGDMKTKLDAIQNYNQLQDLELDLTTLLNTNQTAFKPGKRMPMTGVAYTDKIYETEAEAKTGVVPLEVHRAMARVEVYLSKEPVLNPLSEPEIELGPGTKITLSQTYTKQYLVRNEYGSNIFGKIYTVDDPQDFKEHSWSWNTGDDKGLPDFDSSDKGRLVCLFYTPERTCSTDKLVLTIEAVNNEGTTRTGKVTIDQFKFEGAPTPVNNVIRNNAYQVYSKITANEIVSTVLDWKDENIEVEF